MFQPKSHNHLRRGLCVAVLVSAWLVPMSSALADDRMETPAIREKYDQASALFEAKNYAKAKQILLEAWSQRKTADVATLLGQTEVKLGNHAEAAKYFAYAVANFPPTEPMKHNEIIKGWLTEEKKHVVTLDVTAKPEGAAVSVDGVTVGTTPLQTSLFLEPGRHIVIVRKDGFKAADRNVDMSAGATDSWDVTLKQEERAAIAPAPRATLSGPVRVQQPLGDPRVDPSTIAASKPNPWIVVMGGAITLGSVVTGLVFNAKANRAEEQMHALQGSTGLYGCFEGGASPRATCDELLDKASSKDTSRNVSTVAFLIGGGAAVGSAVYWLWPRRKPLQPHTDIQVTGSVNSNNANLTISGRF